MTTNIDTRAVLEPAAPDALTLESPVAKLRAAAQRADDAAGKGEPANVWAGGPAWWTIGWIGLLHLGALAAPFCFTWQGLVTAVFLSWLTGAVGVCLGYHRLLAHNSFQTYPWIRRLVAALGTLAGEGSPLFWIAAHRKHHVFSDREGDPHTPRDGAWWSHVIWLFPHRGDLWRQTIDHYAKDLLKDPFMRWLDATFIFWHLALAAALLGIGWIGWGLDVGASLVVWGMCLRLVWVLHVTWLVNSAAHMWGYRNYQTADDSRNLWWVGLLAYGEGWHNNHHAFPGRARHGHRWWEFDLTYLSICLLERLGLAWKVNHGRRGSVATKAGVHLVKR